MGSSHHTNEDFSSELTQQYRSVRRTLRPYTKKLRELLTELIRSENIRFNSIEARTKTTKSFVRKASRSDKSYPNPLSDIHDIVGIRVVLFYSDDIADIDSLIQSEFLVSDKHSYRTVDRLAPDQFGYHSSHYVIQLRQDRRELPEWRGFGDRFIEIQVRTTLQHAWAAISHALQYKSEKDIPKSLQRRLNRLSGLLELADEEFIAIRAKQISVESESARLVADSPSDAPLNLHSISAWLQNQELRRDMIDVGRQGGFIVNTADVTDLGDVGDYASEIHALAHALGISSIADIAGRVAADKPVSRVDYLKQVIHQKYSKEVPGDWIASPSFITYVLLHRLVKPDDIARAREIWTGDPEIHDSILKAAKAVQASSSN